MKMNEWQPPATFAQAMKQSSMAKMHNVLVCHLKWGTKADTRIEKTSKARHLNAGRFPKNEKRNLTSSL